MTCRTIPIPVVIHAAELAQPHADLRRVVRRSGMPKFRSHFPRWIQTMSGPVETLDTPPCMHIAKGEP